MRIVKEDENLRVILDSEIDHHNARDWRDEIDDRAEETRPKKLILDFSKVEFMDSSGLGLIIGRYKLMRILGGEVEVRDPSPRVLHMLDMAGTGKYVKIVQGERK